MPAKISNCSGAMPLQGPRDRINTGARKFRPAVLVISVAMAAYLGSAAPVNADELARLPALLAKIAKEESHSYERLLRRSTTAASEACKNQSWASVATVLRSSGMTATNTATYGDSRTFRCVTSTNAWHGPNDQPVALYLEFTAWRQRSGAFAADTTPPTYKVYNTTAGLIMRPMVSLRSLTTKPWFGENTVIHEALAADPLRRSTKAFPLLAELDLSYGEIRDRIVGGGPSGFRLSLSFVGNAGGTGSGVRLECSATRRYGNKEVSEPVTGWRRREFGQSAGLDSLAADLQRVASAKGLSLHRRLRDASHLVKKAIMNREEQEVDQALVDQGLRRVRRSPNQWGTQSEYVVPGASVMTDGGQSMDLFLEVSASRKESRNRPTKEVVTSACAGLKADVGMPYDEVVRLRLLGGDSAIQKALLHDKVREAAAKYPVIGSVEMTYDVIRNRWRMWDSWGFHVSPEFIPARGDDSSGSRPGVTIPSGLDPPDCGGWTAVTSDFEPEDTLGEPDYHGGSEWHGSGPGSAFLKKKGSSRWHKTDKKKPQYASVHSIADLDGLPRDTVAVKIKSEEVYDGDLKLLAQFPTLTALHIGECEGITDDGLGHLAHLERLECLTLSGESLTGEGLAHLRDLPELRQLTVYSSGKLTDGGIHAVAGLKQLVYLSLNWATQLTDQQLAELSSMGNLRELSMWGTSQISDVGIEHLSRLSRLETLSFSHSKHVTTRGLRVFADMPTLEDLTLGYMPLGDDALEAVTATKSLEYLTLHGLNITDEGLHHLPKLRSLKRLYLTDCHKVSKAGIQRLVRQLGDDFELAAR